MIDQRQSENCQTAILLRTNEYLQHHREILNQLLKQTDLPVYIVADESSGPLAVEPGYNKISIDRNKVIQHGLVNLDSWGWRCGDYFLIIARQELPQFTSFWILEPDVRINFAELSDFFSRYAADDGVDLWAPELERNVPTWAWAPSMTRFHEGPISRCLYPVLRASDRLIDSVHAFRRKLLENLKLENPSEIVVLEPHEYPNDEAVTATVACSNNFIARDLNEHGLVYDQRTFRFRSPYSDRQIASRGFDNLIYHPVLVGDAYLWRLFEFLDQDLTYRHDMNKVSARNSDPVLIEALFHELGADGIRRFVEKRERILAELSSPLNLISRQRLVDGIWRGVDPLKAVQLESGRPDMQGWQSYHRYLSQEIQRLKPEIIVEIGVWKGLSSIHMAKILREHNIPGLVIAIDTWLGGWDHWESPEWFGHLGLKDGHPTIYQTFLNNIFYDHVQEHVLPLALDSINAAHVLKKFAIQPTLIHLDGAHDYAAVKNDLDHWWPLLAPGGSLIGDDYHDHGLWPDVQRAFDDFRARTPTEHFEYGDGKCLLRKPT